MRYLGPAPRLGGPVRYAATTPRPPAPAPVQESSRFWVHAGSFADPLAARLTAESLGETARVNPTDVDGQRMFRVVLGPWTDANAAEQARLSIIARGVRDALLISGG